MLSGTLRTIRRCKSAKNRISLFEKIDNIFQSNFESGLHFFLYVRDRRLERDTSNY